MTTIFGEWVPVIEILNIIGSWKLSHILNCKYKKRETKTQTFLLTKWPKFSQARRNWQQHENLLNHPK